jgi:2,4-dienoyl-CoA reductase (NADPH2)
VPLHGHAVGERVAEIGAGGIGFDVAEVLVHAGPSPSLDPVLWMREWGVADPAQARGGVVKPHVEPSPRQVYLLQRKETGVGKGLGKTTGWIHRAALKAKRVEMIPGVNYESIDARGLNVTFGEKREDPRRLEVDTIVLCAGQEPLRELLGPLQGLGRAAHLIGGADVAAELDAKRAIDQGTRLAARL